MPFGVRFESCKGERERVEGHEQKKEMEDVIINMTWRG